jgi:hypothetical protein
VLHCDETKWNFARPRLFRFIPVKADLENKMTCITPFKKTIAGGLAAVTLATSLVALSATDASAQWRRGGWGGGGWGPGIAAGVVGGLAVGALAAGAYGPRYYGPPPVYYPGGCYYTPQRVWTGYRWVVRRVEVCE